MPESSVFATPYTAWRDRIRLTSMERIQVNIDKEWLTVADVCEYMDVSTFVVTSMLRSGEVPAVKVGREWRVSKLDFEKWINEQRSRAFDR